ncbi:MAG TPA: hypothetical protein VFA09_11550 [Ktedonobacteraceae bacterium]|nr:hypothetical protein [Ktedonobacteraceae bacterium]
METCMLGYERAITVTEIAAWANGLIGKEVPGYPEYLVVKVLQFQVMPTQNGYDAMLLIDVRERPGEHDQIALSEADIQVIEQLTSTITEAPEGETTLPE